MNHIYRLIGVFLILLTLVQASFAQIQFKDSGQQLGNACSWSVQLGDLDNDGDLDAVVRNSHYQNPQVNHIWLNDGSGQFSSSNQILEDSDFALGDIDGDDDIDIFLADKILMNDGNGNFTEHGSPMGERAIGTAALGDLDNDGDLDAFIVRENQSSTIWLNDGYGNLTDTKQNLQGTGASQAFLSDLDQDGDLDAFIRCGAHVASVPGNPNLIFLNDGSGTFTDSNQQLGNANSFDVAIADVNNDSYMDIVVANYHAPPSGGPEQRDRLYFNNGDGTFVDSGQEFPKEISRGVEFGDLDSDGDMDIFIFHSCGSVSGMPDKVWINSGKGQFTDSGLRIGNSSSGKGALGDLDGDGDLDVFVPVTDFNKPGGANKVYLNVSNESLDINNDVKD